MRRQYRSFVATMIVVSLCCGFVGCKSNGGSWYKPTSYNWHNPFKKPFGGGDDYGLYAEESNGIRYPSQGQNPDLTIPSGGYSDERVAQNNNIQRTGVPAAGGSLQNQNPAVAMSNPAYQNHTMNPQATNWQTNPYPNNNTQGYPPSNQNYSPNYTPQNNPQQYTGQPQPQPSYQPQPQPQYYDNNSLGATNQQVPGGYAQGSAYYDEWRPGNR